MPNYEQVIQTMYSGCRFRSRLEARWAVLLDRLGADWEYEPEGFVLSDETYYLPDFLVHNVEGRAGGDDLWIEVKGEMTQKDADKVNMFAFPDGMLTGLDKPDRKIFVVGGIPHFKDFWDLHRQIEEAKESDPFSKMYSLETVDGDNWGAMPAITKSGKFCLHAAGNVGEVDTDRTVNAYAAALQARFEHGETPRGIKNRTAW